LEKAVRITVDDPEVRKCAEELLKQTSDEK
jgi:hypothetical protein